MYVICFYWQGDRWQQDGFKYDSSGYRNRQQPFLNKVGNVPNDLPAKYVNNLYKGVLQYTVEPFHFICFTNEKLDVLPGIEIRPFRKVTQMGVLPRLYMFSEEAGLFGHQVLCLDIDILITGSLVDIMNYDGLFCARSKFRFGEGHKLDGDIMSFRAGKETEKMFWKPFIRNVKAVEKQTEGRERYWYRQIANDTADRWDVVVPNQVISYKRHVMKRIAMDYPDVIQMKRERHRIKRLVTQGGNPLPENARIVSCHGTPRPDQIQGQWVKKYWK
jgi:hypothetical protein